MLLSVWFLRRIVTNTRGPGQPLRRQRGLHGWTWPPFLEAHGKQFHQPGPSSVSPHSLLVRALTGQTLVVRWSSFENVLLFASGRLIRPKAHADRFERSVTHHRSQLETCVANRDQKLAEITKLENEYRLLTDGKLSPNASPSVSAHVSPFHSDCESEGENAMEMEEAPPASSSPPLLSGESAAHAGENDLPGDRVVACLQNVAYSRLSHSCQSIFLTALKINVQLFWSSCGSVKANWTSNAKDANETLP